MNRSSLILTGCVTIAAVLALALPAQAQTVVDFEDLTLSIPDSYYNGSDAYGEFDPRFTSQGAGFNNKSSFFDPFFSWFGFGYSNVTDITTPGFGNQYGAYNVPGGGTGAGGSANYGIASVDYVPPAFISPGFEPYLPKITLPDGAVPLSVQIANTTYGALSMLLGDSFAKKFGGPSGTDPDFLLLTISGYDQNDVLTGTVDFYLADYRFSDDLLDYVIDQWTTVDLSPLGDAHWLSFDMSTSDMSDFGGGAVYPNTPFSFALDNLEYSYAAVPEPSSLLLLGVAGVAAGLRRRWKAASQKAAE